MGSNSISPWLLEVLRSFPVFRRGIFRAAHYKLLIPMDAEAACVPKTLDVTPFAFETLAKRRKNFSADAESRGEPPASQETDVADSVRAGNTDSYVIPHPLFTPCHSSPAISEYPVQQSVRFGKKLV